MRVAPVLPLVLSWAGCSFSMQTLPSRQRPTDEPRCSDAPTAPAVDIFTAFALGALDVVATWQAAQRCEGFECLPLPAFAAAAAAPAVAYAVSGVYGLVMRGRCMRAKRRWLERGAAAASLVCGDGAFVGVESARCPDQRITPR